jgi:hypothetical protein
MHGLERINEQRAKQNWYQNGDRIGQIIREGSTTSVASKGFHGLLSRKRKNKGKEKNNYYNV